MLGKLYGLRVMCTTRSPYSLGRPKNALRWILPLPCSTRPCLAFAMPQPSQTILSCAIALHHSSALYDATASLSSAPPLLISPLLCVDWRYLAARGFAFASLCSALCCTAFARHICTMPLPGTSALYLCITRQHSALLYRCFTQMRSSSPLLCLALPRITMPLLSASQRYDTSPLQLAALHSRPTPSQY